MNNSNLDYDHIYPINNISYTGSEPRAIVNLMNARVMASKFDSFNAPKDSDLRKIKPGDFVKIARNNERFWVKVSGYVGRRWHGVVANDLKKNKDISIGDVVYFMRRNIYDTITATSIG